MKKMSKKELRARFDRRLNRMTGNVWIHPDYKEMMKLKTFIVTDKEAIK